MYLTFYTTKTISKNYTFDEILLNPFLKIPEKEKIYKKITIPIQDYYGKQLYDKNYTNPLRNEYLNTESLIKLDTSNHYKHFEIPKKSDPRKKRPIDAPDEYLKNIQTVYKHYIEDYLKVLPHDAAHAYVKNRSTITAMQKHKNNKSKWFLQIDLKNFFNSINGEFLNKMLLEVYPFKYIPKNTLDILTNIALLNNELPQGSILSPTLTNLIMVPIDKEITDTLTNYEYHHYVYTRYADDITISCKQKFDPEKILNVILSIFERFEVPFKINDEKTRFGSVAGRNFHLGIIINNQNNMSIGHRKNDKFRAMIFNFCTTGEEWDIKDVQKMLGLISYYKSIEKPFVEKTINKYNAKFNIDIMEKAKQLLK